MTLRDRCEALVREWRADSADYPIDMADCANALQAALDATADEGRDAAVIRWAEIASEGTESDWQIEQRDLRRYFAAMKESNP